MSMSIFEITVYFKFSLIGKSADAQLGEIDL